MMPRWRSGRPRRRQRARSPAAGSLLVIAADVTQAPNDKQQLEPMLDQIAELPDALGQVSALLADNRRPNGRAPTPIGC